MIGNHWRLARGPYVWDFCPKPQSKTNFHVTLTECESTEIVSWVMLGLGAKIQNLRWRGQIACAENVVSCAVDSATMQNILLLPSVVDLLAALTNNTAVLPDLQRRAGDEICCEQNGYSLLTSDLVGLVPRLPVKGYDSILCRGAFNSQPLRTGECC